MATISKLQDLVPHLGSVVTADDPIAALEQAGLKLSPDLKTQLQARKKPTAAQRKAWNKAAAEAGNVRFTVGADPVIAPRALGPGEFEFSAGLRFSLANEILGGAHASGVIPNTLFLDQLLPAGERSVLQAAFVVGQDTPGGQVGRMQITSPPTIEAIREGFNRVFVSIPFRLNFERILSIATGSFRTVVTFATGRLRLSVGLVTESTPVTATARNLQIQIDLSDSIDARMEIDASSPAQRITTPAPGQVDGLAVLLQNALQLELKDFLRFAISAAIPLPIGRLEIHETAIITRGDALLVGVKVQGTPGTGDPNTLRALFPDADTNFFTRVHEQVLRLLVQAAARSGQLTRIAKDTHPDAVIDSADVAFGKDTIKIIGKGKIVDLCPLNVDLTFTATVTITITLDTNRIIIHQDKSRNLGNGSAALCVLTTLGLALIVAIGSLILNGIGIASGLTAVAALGVIGVLTTILEFDAPDFELAFGGGGDSGPTIVDLDFPYPGTDLLPTATGNFIRLDESTMLLAAHLGTRPDTLNTYLYVRFVEADAVGVARAMSGVSVKLMDRDAVSPAGDDVTLPPPSTSTSGQHTPSAQFAIVKKTHFERTADETFGEFTTDFAGRIRVYIPSDKLVSRGGNKVVETTRINLETGDETTTTRRTPFPEANPDFYFRVKRANGTVVDTLSLPAGFFVNFRSHRVGTFNNPLTISFGGGVLGGTHGGVLVLTPTLL
ncbi:MAG: hypothetical protein GC160_08475 [Acidobacteria bacterium]|nr:hypothetical protein [Acidobacteriota bacterium]